MQAMEFVDASGVPCAKAAKKLVHHCLQHGVLVVDLGRPGVLAAIGQISLPVIGFASHVDRELLAAARAAGCATVLARSAFFSRVGTLLSDP